LVRELTRDRARVVVVLGGSDLAVLGLVEEVRVRDALAVVGGEQLRAEEQGGDDADQDPHCPPWQPWRGAPLTARLAGPLRRCGRASGAAPARRRGRRGGGGIAHGTMLRRLRRPNTVLSGRACREGEGGGPPPWAGGP